MNLRTNFGLLLLSCFPLAAMAQDPAKELADLTAEKQRLLAEIQFVKTRVAQVKTQLGSTLGKDMAPFRTIDAGKSVTAPPVMPPVARRPARIMMDDERSSHAGNEMVLVNGSPIRQEAFDELLAYLKDSPVEESIRATIALADLIRIEAMASAFPESEAEAQLPEALAEIEGGKDFAEVAKARGTIRGATDARIDVTRHSQFGLKLEQVAFSLQPGSQSRPFRHHTGITVLKCVSLEKGATRDLDKAVVDVLNIPYSNDPDTIAKMENQLSMGQVEIIVRDQEVMQMLPPVYQDPDTVRQAQLVDAGRETEPKSGASAVDALAHALEQLDAEIAEVQKLAKPEDKARLKELMLSRREMHNKLTKLREMNKPQEPKKD